MAAGLLSEDTLKNHQLVESSREVYSQYNDNRKGNKRYATAIFISITCKNHQKHVVTNKTLYIRHSHYHHSITYRVLLDYILNLCGTADTTNWRIIKKKSYNPILSNLTRNLTRRGCAYQSRRLKSSFWSSEGCSSEWDSTRKLLLHTKLSLSTAKGAKAVPRSRNHGAMLMILPPPRLGFWTTEWGWTCSPWRKGELITCWDLLATLACLELVRIWNSRQGSNPTTPWNCHP